MPINRNLGSVRCFPASAISLVPRNIISRMDAITPIAAIAGYACDKINIDIISFYPQILIFTV